MNSTAILPRFNSRVNARRRPPQDREIVLDSFAGAGGWGLGEEHGTGWAIDVAINHDALALETYQANHPATRIYCSDVFEVHPQSVEPGRRFAHCHFSPDCTHHSKARGGAPVSDRVRGLAWIVLAWAYHRRPRVITLENVEEFRKWGPTIKGKTGRVADPARAGETFEAFIGALSTGIPSGHPALDEIHEAIGKMVPMREIVKGLGYKVQHRELRACDFGAPTIRKRFFMVARCDGERIRWPKPTHGPADHPEVLAGRLQPWQTAADWIDWSLPCPSIFMTKKQADEYYRATGQRVQRPLRPATMARVANGFWKHVASPDAQPYIVSVNHGESGGRRVYSIDEPMRTICSGRRGEALVTPYLVSCQNASNPNGTHSGNKPMPTICAFPKGGGHAVVAPILIGAGGTTGTARPRRVDRPLKTVKTSDRQAVVSFIARHFGGMVSRDVNKPLPTITARPTQNQVVTAHLMHQFTSNTNGGGGKLDEPLKTILAGGNHAALIYSFLVQYYGSGSGKKGRDLNLPLPTITGSDRFGVVIVEIRGEPYVVVDIGMRMLQPHELLGCQFGEYADGWVLMGTKTQKTAGIGNSVCPHVARAIVKANVKIRKVTEEVAA